MALVQHPSTKMLSFVRRFFDDYEDNHAKRLFLVTVTGLTVAFVFEIGFQSGGSVQPTTQQRVARLATSLTEATQLIDQMQSDIQSRQAMVTKLQSDLETYNELAALKKEEVEAVAQVLRGEIDRNARTSFLQNVAVNFTFFILGAIVSWFVGRRQAAPKVASTS